MRRQIESWESSLRRELEVEPDAPAVHLYQDILTARFPGPDALPGPSLVTAKAGHSTLPAHPLPIQLTRFIGREREKTEIIQMLSLGTPPIQAKPVAGVRLLTLTGAGGCGKTRLALEAANDLEGSYRDGIWLVELADLSDPDLVPQALAAALNLRDSPDQPVIKRLVEFLKIRQALMVLDNCEHLVEACARLAETLLRSCPKLQILATSQEGLGIPGEVTYLVPPLSLPTAEESPILDRTNPSEAMSLFADRASTALPGFILTNENAPVVAQICQRLDGIPLAIELAAAQVKLMQVDEIAARLDQRFRMLVGGSRTAPPRQKSLSASIDWSYQLLTAPERLLFRRLAVFAGGWSLEAAEQVTGSGQREAGFPLSPENVAGLLALLVNKSLVTVRRGQGEQTRYYFLETIRQYAIERLKAAGEEPEFHCRHLAYFCRLAEQADLELRGPRQAYWMKQISLDHANLREAFEWALKNPRASVLPTAAAPREGSDLPIVYGLRLAGAMFWYWHFGFNRLESGNWLERALAAEILDRGQAPIHPDRAAVRARALYACAWFEGLPFHIGKGYLHLAECLALYRTLGPAGRRGVAYALNSQVDYARERGDLMQMSIAAEESLALFREVGDKFGLAQALSLGLAHLAIDQGDFERGKAYQEEAQAIYQELGDRSGVAWSFLRLGEVFFYGRGDYPQAMRLFEKVLAMYREIADRPGIFLVLTQMGIVALAQGDEGLAGKYFGERLAIAREAGDQFAIAETLNLFGRIALVQRDDHRAAQLFTETLKLNREFDYPEAVTHSLHGLAEVALLRDDMVTARSLLREVFSSGQEPADRWTVFHMLESFGELAAKQDQPARAAHLLAAAAAMHMLFILPPGERARHEVWVSRIKLQLGEEGFAQAWAQGSALTRDQAIAEALQYNDK